MPCQDPSMQIHAKTLEADSSETDSSEHVEIMPMIDVDAALKEFDRVAQDHPLAASSIEKVDDQHVKTLGGKTTTLDVEADPCEKSEKDVEEDEGDVEEEAEEDTSKLKIRYKF